MRKMPPEGHVAHALARHLSGLGWTVVWEPEQRGGITLWGPDNDFYDAPYKVRMSRSRQQAILGVPLADVPLILASGGHKNAFEKLVLEWRLEGLM